MSNISRTSSSSSTSSGYSFDPSMSSNMNFKIPHDPSPNLRAFLSFIDALHRWDFDDIMDCFDETLEHRILPQSLGRPVLNKKQYAQYFRAIFPIFQSWRVRDSPSSLIRAFNEALNLCRLQYTKFWRVETQSRFMWVHHIIC